MRPVRASGSPLITSSPLPMIDTMRRRLLAAAAACACVLSPSASAAPLPQAADCPVFPRDNQWNLPVDKLPVTRDSKKIVGGIGARAYLHNNFGGGIWEGSPDGMPITVVGGDQLKGPV